MESVEASITQSRPGPSSFHLLQSQKWHLSEQNFASGVDAQCVVQHQWFGQCFYYNSVDKIRPIIQSVGQMTQQAMQLRLKIV
jgi:hypothetical protein